MGTILLIVIAVVIFLHLSKSSAAKKAQAGGYDNIISQLESYYATVRQYHKELGTGVISISTYWLEINGAASSSSGAMSVCLTEGTNDQLANSLGMKVSTIK